MAKKTTWELGASEATTKVHANRALLNKKIHTNKNQKGDVNFISDIKVLNLFLNLSSFRLDVLWITENAITGTYIMITADVSAIRLL